ncbi:MAG: hypothetical protein MZV64_71065 [Ignavibacteriales bacterium]|nr:hypothetical protein [Ignavibacteriales bacterium]
MGAAAGAGAIKAQSDPATRASSTSARPARSSWPTTVRTLYLDEAKARWGSLSRRHADPAGCARPTGSIVTGDTNELDADRRHRHASSTRSARKAPPCACSSSSQRIRPKVCEDPRPLRW